jgi:alcohol dehydrogenase class IV
MKSLGHRDPHHMVRIAAALDAFPSGAQKSEAPARAADALARVFADIGMPARLRELAIPREGLEAVLADSMKNFNADPRREFLAHRDALHAALLAAW